MNWVIIEGSYSSLRYIPAYIESADNRSVRLRNSGFGIDWHIDFRPRSIRINGEKLDTGAMAIAVLDHDGLVIGEREIASELTGKFVVTIQLNFLFDDIKELSFSCPSDSDFRIDKIQFLDCGDEPEEPLCDWIDRTLPYIELESEDGTWYPRVENGLGQSTCDWNEEGEYWQASSEPFSGFLFILTLISVFFDEVGLVDISDGLYFDTRSSDFTTKGIRPHKVKLVVDNTTLQGMDVYVSTHSRYDQYGDDGEYVGSPIKLVPSATISSGVATIEFDINLPFDDPIVISTQGTFLLGGNFKILEVELYECNMELPPPTMMYRLYNTRAEDRQTTGASPNTRISWWKDYGTAQCWMKEISGSGPLITNSEYVGLYGVANLVQDKYLRMNDAYPTTIDLRDSLTFFCIVELKSTPEFLAFFFSLVNVGSQNVFSVGFNSSGGIVVAAGTADPVETGIEIGSLVDEKTLVCVTVTNSNVRIRINGEEIVVGIGTYNNSNSIADDACINGYINPADGSHLSGFSSDCKIPTIMLYDSILEREIMEFVEGGLAWEYDLVDSLAEDHPYKEVSPADGYIPPEEEEE